MSLSRTPLSRSRQCLSVLCLMTIDVHPATLQDRFPLFPPFFFPVFFPPLLFQVHDRSDQPLPSPLSPSHAPKFSGVLQTGRRRAGLSSSGTRGFKLREGRREGRREDRGLSRNDRPFTLMHPIKTGARNQIKPRVELEGGKNDPTALSKLDVTNESRSIGRSNGARRTTTANVHLKSA